MSTASKTSVYSSQQKYLLGLCSLSSLFCPSLSFLCKSSDFDWERGEAQSFCFLVSDALVTIKTRSEWCYADSCVWTSGSRQSYWNWFLPCITVTLPCATYIIRRSLKICYTFRLVFETSWNRFLSVQIKVFRYFSRQVVVAAFLLLLFCFVLYFKWGPGPSKAWRWKE